MAFDVSIVNEENNIQTVIAKKDIDPTLWIKENRQDFEQLLLKKGGILLRDFNINSLSEFNDFSQEVCPNLMEYTYRSTPRTNLGGKLYTATEYPASLSIPLHNENSYSKRWPQKIMFFCAICPEEGGQTPLADSRQVYTSINKEVREKFEKYGVMYIRNYTPGLDLDWRIVFQTSDKKEVEKYCQENDIEYNWGINGAELTTKQVCQATLQHPETKEEVWFNQAHLFHHLSIEAETGISLTNELSIGSLPRNACYGNGDPISLDALDAIRAAYKEHEIIFNWKRGDLLILDNILMAHGRKPFKGERKIVVSMG